MSDTAQGLGWWQASDGKWYPPQPSQAWATPPASPPGYRGPMRTSGKATAALILAIASMVVCPIIPAVIALVLASQARKEIAASGGSVGGSGLATAATIISIVHFALVGLVALLIIAISLLGTNATVHLSRVGDSLSLVRIGFP